MNWKCLQTVTPKTYMRVQTLHYREQIHFYLKGRIQTINGISFFGCLLHKFSLKFQGHIHGSEKLSISNLSFNTKISIKIKHLSRVLEQNYTNRPDCVTATSYGKKCPRKETIPTATQFIRL